MFNKNSQQNNHNDKSIEKAEARNAARLTATAEKIAAITANGDNAVNAYALDIIKLLKSSKNPNNKAVTDKMYSLCAMLIHSKLNKLQREEKTYHSGNAEIKRQVAAVTARDGGERRDTYLAELAKLYIISFNDKGEIVVTCTDSRRAAEIDRALAELAATDGEDILQSAMLKLWYYINKAIEKYGYDIPDTYLLDIKKIVIPSSKVYRNGDRKPSELWQYRATNAVKETSLEIGRQLRALKSVKDNDKAYISLDILVEKENADIQDDSEVIDECDCVTVYRRAPIAAISAAADDRGRETVAAADSAVAALIADLPSRANLNNKERYIYSQYIVGEKNGKQVCKALNISDRTFTRYAESARHKCAAVLAPVTGYAVEDAARDGNAVKSRRVEVYRAAKDGKRGEYIGVFGSIYQAAAAVKVNKDNAAKVLCGKRTHTGGYIFKYAK